MFAVVVLLMLSMAGTVSAFGVLGPPTAGLNKGQVGIGIEYACSDSDVEISGFGGSGTLEGLESNMLLGQIGYGISDVWEIYGLLGTADNESDDLDPIDFSYDFAYGFGTKFTFAKDEKLSWGIMFEMGWKSGDDSVSGIEFEIAYSEMHVAVGPTWNAAEGVHIYGGPFFYMLDGDYEIHFGGDTYSFDLEEESSFGGYFGAQFDVSTTAALCAEFQLTGDMSVFGVGFNWRF